MSGRDLLTMRGQLRVAVATAALLASFGAIAADLDGSLKDTWVERPAIATDWSGFYGGVHGGVGVFTGMAMDWGYDVFSVEDGNIDQIGFAGLFGAQLGFNRQFGNVVWGLEADIAKTGYSRDRTFVDGRQYVKAEMDWLATLRGRLGLATGNAMAYATAGVAWAQLNHCANHKGLSLDRCSTDNHNDIAWDGVTAGLVAGAGVEAALGRNWSLKGEYLFVQMDTENVVYNTTNDDDIDFSNRSHLVRLGLNYHRNELEVTDTPSGGPWNGLYAGFHGGIGAFTGTAIDWERGIFDDPDGDIDQTGFAGLFGAQIGLNRQIGNVVWGLEADIAKSGYSRDRTFVDGDYYVKSQMDWLATLRGRIGLASGNALAYVTAGLAWAQLEHCANTDSSSLDPCSTDNSNDIAWSGVTVGLAAGAGIEAALGRNWSLKGEVLFVQMDTETVVYDTSSDYDIDFSNSSHLIRLGLNYHLTGLEVAETPVGGPWNGVYAGLHGGIGAFTGMAMDWDRNVFDRPDGDIDQTGFAALFGAQIGLNRQIGTVVWGFEADIARTGYSQDRTLNSGAFYVKAEMDWLATLRGRLGLAAGNALAYVTAGVAWAQLDHCANRKSGSLDPCSTDSTNIAWDGVTAGLVAGAGVEAALGRNWSLKSEYLFVQMAPQNVVYDDSNDYDIDFSNRSHLVRVGLNYKLDGLFGRTETVDAMK